MKGLYLSVLPFAIAVTSSILVGCQRSSSAAISGFWSRNQDRYERVVGFCRSDRGASSRSLDGVDSDLAVDHTAWIDRDGVFRVKFLLKRWDIDESYGLVYQEPATPLPKSDRLFEVWSETTRLADGWYLVRGT